MRKLILAACLSLAATSASASGISMADGVHLIPDTSVDLDDGNGNFSNPFEFIQWWDDTSVVGTDVDSISGFNASTASNFVLQGIGELLVSDVADNDTGKLACNGCELTFMFGGIQVDVGQILNPLLVTIWQGLPGNVGFPTEADIIAMVNALGLSSLPVLVDGPLINTSNAFLNVYADYSQDLDFGAVYNDEIVDATEMAQAQNGDLWLALEFNESLFVPQNINDGVFGLSGIDSFFSFNAVGGSALANFVDNSIRDVDNALSIFSDVVGTGLTSTFNVEDDGSFDLYSINGAGTISGVAVSAPANLAILGLGIFGLAFAARRKA
jgi:hypothetical protein